MRKEKTMRVTAWLMAVLCLLLLPWKTGLAKEEMKKSRAAQESIYLSARSDAVALNRAEQVTIGDIKTQLPEGYEGYIRKITKCTTNFENKSFTAQSGPLKDREGCMMLDTEDKGKYYAWYRKSMYYQGIWVDIKMTLTNFKLREGGYFRFIATRPGIETYKVEWAETKMEFFRADNGEVVNVKGYVTYQDIDLYQGIVLKKGYEGVYASKEAVGNLKAAVINGNNYYFDTSGLDQNVGNKGFMFSALLQGSSATARFTFIRPENNIGTSLTPSGGISAKAYKLFANAHPHIEKYVSDQDEKLVSENLLDNRNETFTYTLRTMIPMENEETFYTNMEIYDTLDADLQIQNIKVVNENGADASAYWEITKANAFAAKCRNIKNADFYGHTYDFQITVFIRSNADLKRKWNVQKQAAVLQNQAEARSDGKTVKSQTVITKILPLPSSVAAEKRDARTKQGLSGAEFAVYEWAEDHYQAEPLTILKESRDGRYTSGEILLYTEKNQGKFKITEKKAPEGYKKENWEKTFTIDGFQKQNVAYTDGNACFDEPLWIRIKVKKKDFETGKDLAQAEFALYQWNEEKQDYLVCTEDFKISTDENGEGVTKQLFYTPENKGRFRILEEKAPQNYFGDYKEEDPKNGKQTYDFIVTEKNSGQILELSNRENKTGFYNQPQKASIKIKKMGEVLKNVQQQKGNLEFLYEEEALKGAEYEIIAAEDIYHPDGITLALKEGETVDTIVTGADGTAVSKELYLGTYHIVETHAPQGYLRKKTAQENTKKVTLHYQGENIKTYVYDNVLFKNERPKADVQVWKKSEDSKKGLAGAIFGLYSEENIYADGKILVQKGQLLETAISQKDGSCHFQSDLPCGYRYAVKEIQAPENYYKQVQKENYTFFWSYQDDSKEVYHFPEAEEVEKAVFYNREVKAEISLQKVDAGSQLAEPQQMGSLKGAVYGLYARETIYSADGSGDVLYQKETEIQRKETDEKGRLIFAQVPLGKYEIKEIKASEGYLADPQNYEVDCDYEGQDIAVIKRKIKSKERIKMQPVICFKLTGDNKETDLEWIKGAGFSVYSIKELEDTGKLKSGSTKQEDALLVQQIIDSFRDKESLDYHAMRSIPTVCRYDALGNAERLQEIFSDEKGIVSIPELPYGKYILVETTVPEKQKAAAPKILTIDSDEKDEQTDGDGKGHPLPEFAIWDQPKTSYLKIRKKDCITGKTVSTEGAAYVIHDVEGKYFNWYMKDKTSEERVDYINRYGNLVVAYTNGEILGSYENPFVTENRKNAQGETDGTYVTTTTTLPQGLYILEEVEAPENYIKQGFEGRYRKKWGSVFFEAEAGLSGIEKIHSLKVAKEEIGSWERAETASKDSRVHVQIGEETTTTYDRKAGDFVTEIFQANEPAVGKLSIYTEGEKVKRYQKGKGFVYECKPLAGNVFTIRAKEDIYSNEGKDSAALLFAKGSVVAELITDENGKACTEKIQAAGWEWYGLPLGIYTIEQTKAADGYVLSEENQKPRTFEILYRGQEVPILFKSEFYEIQRQKVQIQIEKTDADNQKKLEGAEFALYAGKDICDEAGNVLLKEGSEIERVRSDANGSAIFQKDLPEGIYIVRETEAPAGYYPSNQEKRFVFKTDEKQKEIETFFMKAEMKNIPVRVRLFLKDNLTKQELSDAKFQILDEKGEVHTVITTENTLGKGMEISGLSAGEKYKLVEILPRSGYKKKLLLTTESERLLTKTDEKTAEFFIEPDEWEEKEDERPKEIRLEVENEFLTGKVRISKTGEILNEVKRTTNVIEEFWNKVSTLFSYQVSQMEGAEFLIRAKEDIMHPDGVSGVVCPAGDIAEYQVRQEKREKTMGITDNFGVLEFLEMYPGIYELEEKKAPEGYQKIENPITFTLAETGDGTKAEPVEKEISVYNERQKVEIQVTKREKENPEKRLAGAVFGLYAAFDIRTQSGELLLEKGTLLETQQTDENGSAVFREDLPLGKYEVREILAPEGYIKSEQCEEIEAIWQEEKGEIQKFSLDFENPITKVWVTKRASDTKDGLEGAKLAVYKGERCIESWITEKEPHLVKGLEIGETYLLKELTPTAGYTTALEQSFQVEEQKAENYEGQFVEMWDLPTEIHIAVFEKDGDKKVSLGKVKAHLETSEGKNIYKDQNPSGKDGAWVSKEDEEEIWKKLAIGKYKVVVDEVPEGYVLPESKEIEVLDTAEIQKFEILVSPICVRLTAYALPSAAAKESAAKKQLAGTFAHLTGKTETTSEELPYTYTHLAGGSYEIQADRIPKGFLMPSVKKIEVRKDTEEIQEFDLELRPTVIQIQAVDKKTQKTLEGVKVNVWNERGKIVWKKVSLPFLQEKVIPAWYTIRTAEVPNGYQKPENKKIQVKETAKLQKYKIELVKKQEDKEEKGKNTNVEIQGADGTSGGNVISEQEKKQAATTGDMSNPEIWIVILCLAAACGILSFSKRKSNLE